VKKPDGNEEEAKGGSKREPVNDHAERKEGGTSGVRAIESELGGSVRRPAQGARKMFFGALLPSANGGGSLVALPVKTKGGLLGTALSSPDAGASRSREGRG
jgi:hypothetical protein